MADTPRMAIHMATGEARRVCIASAVCGYRTKMSSLGDLSILNTQIHCEHSETPNSNFITIKFGKLNFRQTSTNYFSTSTNFVDHVILFVEGAG